MSTTIASVIDRVRSICVADPFYLKEAPSPFDFATVPEGAIDGSFRLEVVGTAIRSSFHWSEEHEDALTISIARWHGSDPATVYASAFTECHSLTAAILRDATEQSGEYAVLDRGRVSAPQFTPGANYSVYRLTLPVSYMADV